MPQKPDGGDESKSSHSRFQSSLDVTKWATALWEFTGSGQITAAVTADSRVGPARSVIVSTLHELHRK